MKAIVSGQSDPRRLAELGHPQLACTRVELAAALEGRLRDHHRFPIGQHLKTIELDRSHNRGVRRAAGVLRSLPFAAPPSG